MAILKNSRTKHAITLLKQDHKEVKGLFDQFEAAKGTAAKKKIAEKALEELKVHATIEEELFYPALRKEMEEKDILEEADEEHHVAKVLIAELDLMNGSEENYEAKFLVLAENVRHHIKEEENEMFPEAKKLDVDFETLGERMYARKQELKSSGVPKDAEAAMVEKSGLRIESPAKKAARSFSVPRVQ